MKGILFSFFLSLIFLSPYSSSAQNQRDHYDLLWKISGNGLSKPSYLFGTMHLNDKRVFDFSDSVIAKIQECQGFALEVAPDSMAQFIALIMMDREKDSIKRDFKKDLTEKEYAILKEKLRAETSLDLDQVNDRTPQQIANLLNSPLLSHNDNATFLDGYLYRIALGEKKSIHGLEQFSDKAFSSESEYDDGMDDLREIIYATEYKASLDQLIQLYYEGDIEKINKWVVSKDTSSLALLYRRNHNMVARIQENSAKQTLFYAVGAAHLAGDEGIISLLKKKGYTLTPVTASFTGEAAKYKPKAIDLTWQQYTFADEGYAVSLPGKPVLYPLKEEMPISMYVYPDLATGLFYFTMSLSMPFGNDNVEMKKVMDGFIKGMFKQKEGKAFKQKTIVFKGTKASEAEFYNAKDKMYGKVRILQKFGFIYFQLVCSYKKEALKLSDTQSFFESLELTRPKTKKKIEIDTTVKEEVSKHYVSKKGAYTVDSFCELKEYDSDIDTESGIIKAFFLKGEDKHSMSYWAGYYLFPAGLSIIEDSSYLANFTSTITESTDLETAQIKDIIYKGYPGKSFYKRDKNGLLVKMQIVLRGSRVYLFFVVGTDEQLKRPAVDQFMASLDFLPFEKSSWSSYEIKAQGLQWSAPADAVIETDTTGSYEIPYEQTYSTIDTCSGISYVVDVNHYSPYYSITKEDFYKIQKDTYVGDIDSLVSEKKYTIQGIDAVEWTVKVKASHNLKRILVIPVDNHVAYLYSYLPTESVHSEVANQFFSSLKLTKARTTLFDSKAQQLLKDLASNDSTVHQDAFNMLESYRFKLSEKNLVYAELHKLFSDDSLSYENTRSILLSRLTDLEDTSTVSFINALYPELKSYPGLQIVALRTLLELKSGSSKEVLFKLINTDIPVVDYIPYDFFTPLKDSTALNAALYPEVFTLIKSCPFRNDLYGLAISLLDSNLIKKDFFTLHMDQLLAFSKEDLETAEDYNTPYLAVWNSITFFGRFTEQKEVLDYLLQMTHHSDDVLAFEAVKQLLSHKTPVDPSVLLHFAAQNKYRLTLYQLLNDSGQVKLFPAKWYKQEYFAEADLYNFMGGYDDEFYYEKIQLINSKVITYKGVSSRFFLFKLLSEGEWYVGISGPYDLDKQKVFSEGKATNSLYETLKSKSINVHYEDLLKEQEEVWTE
ncbi:MAG: TraB/GumN family protein [Chitinophagaceae bacterium]|nr:TraB/GumN family protein [Chitinophagaceae bacterium]